MKPHLTCAQDYWKRLVQPGDLIIDATVGNGHDTLFLAQLLQGEGALVGYDIQSQALESALKRLSSLPPSIHRTVSFKKQSHHQFDEKNVKLIVYNLGYLPGGNKQLTTLSETTLLSLHSALQALAPNGAISITCYPGHEEGRKEENAIREFLKTLSATRWSLCHHQWLRSLPGP
jgi:hypothetical protein